MLDLSQFEIETDGMLTHLYFYENLEDIYAVFSAYSTSSSSAAHFFINAYAFINVLPCDEATRNLLKQEMGSVPDDFYIDDLSRTPNRYIKAEDADIAGRRCQQVLDMILQKQ